MKKDTMSIKSPKVNILASLPAERMTVNTGE